MKKTAISIAVFAVAAIGVFSNFGITEEQNRQGKTGYTGSPGENTCAVSSCHASFGLNDGVGDVSITTTVPATGYVSGTVYSITVTPRRAGSTIFGLGFEALTSSNTNAGTLGSPSTKCQKATAANGRANITHRLNGGLANDSCAFTFTWTAPAASVGIVKMYAVGNAANNNNSSAGDYIYTATITLSPEVVSTANRAFLATAFHISPNPATDVFRINYTLTEAADVQLDLYDLSGKRVSTLSQARQNAGDHDFQHAFSSDVAKGAYLVTLKVNGIVEQTQKLMVF